MKILLMGMFCVFVALLCALIYTTGPNNGIPFDAVKDLRLLVKFGLGFMCLSFILDIDFVRKWIEKWF